MVPYSFVLADLFDVTTHTLDIPDHVIEDDVELDWVVCPCCQGECWIEVEGASAYRDAALAWGRPELANAYKPCTRCWEGVILEPISFTRVRQNRLPALPMAA